jgi:hypothetical protein
LQFRLGTEVDLFENLVPLAIHQALASFSTKQTVLVSLQCPLDVASNALTTYSLGHQRNPKDEGCNKRFKCYIVIFEPSCCIRRYLRSEQVFFLKNANHLFIKPLKYL